MKLSATRDVLLKPLQAVIGVVERRQTMPILSNVLLVAKEGSLCDVVARKTFNFIEGSGSCGLQEAGKDVC